MAPRLLALVALAVGTASSAPIVAIHRMAALAQADVLIVGRVVRIEVGLEVFPPSGQRWRHRVFEHVAEVEPLRFYSADEALQQLVAGAHVVRVSYRAEHPPEQGGIFGGPLWPVIREAETRIFALAPDERGDLRLLFQDGYGIVPPAHAALPRQTPADTPLQFLEREVAAALASGDPRAAFEMGRYLQHAFTGGNDDTNRETGVAAALASMLAGDEGKAAIAAGALLSARPMPRASLVEVLDGAGALRPSERIAHGVLRLLPEDRRERLIIEESLRNLAVYSWGAALTFKELAHHPDLDKPLAEAMDDRRPGVLFLLENLIREGREDLIPGAMTLAHERLAKLEDDPSHDRAPAGRMLWRHGAPEDFDRFFTLLLRAKQSDPALYRDLWNASPPGDLGPRAARLRFLAIYLNDSRPAPEDGLRYSDFALGWLASRVDGRFGLEPKSLQETSLADRDAAIQRAAEWLALEMGNPAP